MSTFDLTITPEPELVRESMISVRICGDCARMRQMADAAGMQEYVQCSACHERERETMSTSDPLFVPLRHRELEERASLIVDGDRVIKNSHHFVAIVDGELVHDPDAKLSKRDEALVRAELHDLARGACNCTGWRCTSCLARREIAQKRARVIMITMPRDSSAKEVVSIQFCQENLLGMEEAIPVILPTILPCLRGDHKGKARDEVVYRMRMAALDLATELYVHNPDGRIDSHMARDIEYAELTGKPIRWLTLPRELCRVCHGAVEPIDNPMVHGDGFAHPACVKGTTP